MNKIAIPALLVATVMVAGMFAFAPVEQASTVHTTAASTENSIKYVTVTATCDVTVGDIDDCDQIEIDVDTGDVYRVVSAQMTATESGGAGTLDIVFTACTQGGDEVATTLLVLDSVAVGANDSTIVSDGIGAVTTTSIGVAGTDDVRCAAATVTTDDDDVSISLVFQINADADDPTVTLFDADDA